MNHNLRLTALFLNSLHQFQLQLLSLVQLSTLLLIQLSVLVKGVDPVESEGRPPVYLLSLFLLEPVVKKVLKGLNLFFLLLL
jgi:hypothetical protein